MILYVDCIGGVAGDMLLGALLDAGATVDLSAFDLEIERGTADRHGITAVTTTITGAAEQPHRDWGTIKQLIAAAGLPERAEHRAQEAFKRLAIAEGRIHDMPPERVHFHEVGAIDAIGEIVGVALALESLHVDRVICSPLPMGRGLREGRARQPAAPRARDAGAAQGRADPRRRGGPGARHADRCGARRGARRVLRPAAADDAARHRLRLRHARPAGVPERRPRDPRHRGHHGHRQPDRGQPRRPHPRARAGRRGGVLRGRRARRVDHAGPDEEGPPGLRDLRPRAPDRRTCRDRGDAARDQLARRARRAPGPRRAGAGFRDGRGRGRARADQGRPPRRQGRQPRPRARRLRARGANRGGAGQDGVGPRPRRRP